MAEGSDILLPPRELAHRIDADDPLEYYYKPFTARLYRDRLRLVIDLLGGRRFSALLEVGYGSGIFLPELARHTGRLAGIDLHGETGRVEEMLGRLGVEAELKQASLYELPFADGEFDALVCVSVLEHLTDLDGAFDEFRRVLAPDGVAALGFPVRNPLTDGFFRLVGYNPRAIHPSGHGDILRAAERHRGFVLERRAHMPRFLPLPVSAYAGCRCRGR